MTSRTCGTPDGDPTDEVPPMPTEEFLARVALTRVVEPGDAAVGGWLMDHPGQDAARRLLAEIVAGRPLGQNTTPARVEGYQERARHVDPVADLRRIARIGGHFICPGTVEWPSQLADLGPEQPVGLWVRGDASLRMWALRSVAVVGARACSGYGAHLAADMAAGLAERGWTVISGAAYGVDGSAHRGALAMDGATVAVLACGVDFVYPPGHDRLLDRIAHRGLILSELPPGTTPTRHRFVTRNRVIAALTRGTVVVEAARRSGALSTAHRSLELGRETMAVPGPATAATSAGAHGLIRRGATLVTSAEEIIEQVGPMGELATEPRSEPVRRELLAPEASVVLEAVPLRDHASVERIARDAGLGVASTLARLYELAGLGFVARDGARWTVAGAGRR